MGITLRPAGSTSEEFLAAKMVSGEHEYSFRISPNVPPFRLAELGKLAVQGGSSGGYAHLFQQFSIARVLAEAFHQWTGFQLGRAGVALL